MSLLELAQRRRRNRAGQSWPNVNEKSPLSWVDRFKYTTCAISAPPIPSGRTGPASRDSLTIVQSTTGARVTRSQTQEKRDRYKAGIRVVSCPGSLLRRVISFTLLSGSRLDSSPSLAPPPISMAVDAVLQNGPLHVKPGRNVRIVAGKALHVELAMTRRMGRCSVPVIMALITGFTAAVNGDV